MSPTFVPEYTDVTMTARIKRHHVGTSIAFSAYTARVAMVGGVDAQISLLSCNWRSGLYGITSDQL